MGTWGVIPLKGLRSAKKMRASLGDSVAWVEVGAPVCRNEGGHHERYCGTGLKFPFGNGHSLLKLSVFPGCPLLSPGRGELWNYRKETKQRHKASHPHLSAENSS